MNFFSELERMQYFIGNDMLEAYKEAKQMEKEQIDGAYSDGWMSCERWFEDKEFYQH